MSLMSVGLFRLSFRAAPVLLAGAVLAGAGAAGCFASGSLGDDKTAGGGAAGSGGSGGSGGGDVGPPPELSVLDAHPVLEDTTANVKVVLSYAWEQDITVRFDTEDATAIGNSGGNGDYVPVSSVITIAAGAIEATVPIDVDTPYKTLTLETSLSRFFRSKITNASAGTIIDPEGVVTLAQAGMVIETPLAGSLGEADVIDDFNGDQRPDLLLSGVTGQAAILLTPGTTFEEAGHVVVDAAHLDGTRGFSFFVNTSPIGADYAFGDHGQASDVNGDGLSDVLVIGEGQAHMLYGRTGMVGNFTQADPRLSDSVSGTLMSDLDFGYGAGPIQTGDWNDDGKLDIGQPHFYSSVAGGWDQFRGFFGEGGMWGPAHTATQQFSFQSGTTPVGQASLTSGSSGGGSADLNGDGIDDIVFVGLSANDGMFGGNYLYARFSDGQTFTDQNAAVRGTLDGSNGFQVSNDQYLSGVRSFTPQDSGDVNGDGIEDLVLTEGGSAISVIFGKSTPYASGSYAQLADMGSEVAMFNTDPVRTARIGDLNRDGIGDIVFITEDRLRVVWGKPDLVGRDIFGTQYPEVGEIPIDPNSGLDMVAVVADFDGDQADDVVVLSDSWNGDTGGALILFGKTITPTLGGPDITPAPL